MNNRLRVGRLAGVAAACGVALGATSVCAETVQADLVGYNEVPSVATVAKGRFKAKIDASSGSIFWELEYEGLQADAQQSHIHLGQRHTNGGITVFLCTNLGNGPAGTQACPVRAGNLNGTIMAGNVLATAATQQLTAGDFDALVRAIRAGATYVNVHSTVTPTGEIRGQIRASRQGKEHHD